MALGTILGVAANNPAQQGGVIPPDGGGGGDITINYGADPTYSDPPYISIKDGNKVIVKVTGAETFGPQYVSASVLANRPLRFASCKVNGIAYDESNRIDLRGKFDFIIRPVFSDPAGSVVVVPFLYDMADILMPQGELTLIATPYKDAAGKYISVPLTINTYGAKKGSVLIKTVTNGTVDIWLAGV